MSWVPQSGIALTVRYLLSPPPTLPEGHLRSRASVTECSGPQGGPSPMDPADPAGVDRFGPSRVSMDRYRRVHPHRAGLLMCLMQLLHKYANVL
jgi:hypothetical protein